VVLRLSRATDFAALDPFFRIIEQGLAVHHDAAKGVVVRTLRESEVARWRDYLDPVAVFDAVGWPPR
jgi:hypothetical protein